ncbi:hypothetical protein SAMN06265377_1485 [Flagellimonas pacifica]|uniref:Prepilin type IV endopeptidase peptidase domain-containing protein n=2 Tax=Flagellimonas pacifica TaxID=1247520 RepID=A0A285MR67_9FLAO|nr:hypothetical protein SAMN06265377_1485 [Allomuricauda parva]
MACIGCISVQDFKERKVYWWLFPLVMLLLGYLHFLNSSDSWVFLNHISLNALLVSMIICILYLFTRIVAKKKFLNHSLGLGDILFFYGFALGFPTLTFIILFSNAILFSLFVFLILKKKRQLKTVPLAGFMGSFLILMFFYVLIFKFPLLYAY